MNLTVMRLTLLALGCGLLINVVYLFNAETIKDNQTAFENAQLVAVTGLKNVTLTAQGTASYAITDEPSSLEDSALEDSTLEKSALEKSALERNIRGYIFSVTTREGYNGTIKFWLAVDTSGTILGVRIYQHQETPGLGDKIELDVSDWVLDFDGRSLANTRADAWQVKRDGGQFDQFSGATITPRAIIMAVHQQLEDFQRQSASAQEKTDVNAPSNE